MQTKIAAASAASAWSFSAQHLFSCGFAASCTTGWMPAFAMTYLKNKGLPDEACFPHESGFTSKRPSCQNTCADWNQRAEIIEDSNRVTLWATDVGAIKKALLQGPVLSLMGVFEDFSYYSAGVYKHVAGKFEGAHAVLIIGWDDAKQAWIVQNSWGTAWGMHGYVYVAWDNKAFLGQNTWQIKMKPKGDFVTLGNWLDGRILQGTVQLPWDGSNPQAGRRWQIWSASTNVFLSEAVWDSRQLPDGEYLIRAFSGLTSSQPRLVRIFNGAFTGDIVAEDLPKRWKNRPEFLIRILTKPVLPESLKLVLTEVKTGKKWTKTKTNLAKKMLVGWNISDLTAGDYRLSFEAEIQGQKIQSSQYYQVKLKTKN